MSAFLSVKKPSIMAPSDDHLKKLRFTGTPARGLSPIGDWGRDIGLKPVTPSGAARHLPRLREA